MNHKWVNYLKTARATDLPAELFGCSIERHVTMHACVCDLKIRRAVASNLPQP